MIKDFRFKRFTVVQRQSAMKVGTDGVLLGAWCRIADGCRNILDIGTGTGLIALMAAQRSEAAGAFITALEPDPSSCEEAQGNFASSPWSGRISVSNRQVQDFEPPEGTFYDLIICNPPYFSDSLLPPSPGRINARHTVGLTHDQLLENTARLLAPAGVFAMIIPCDSVPEIEKTSAEHGLNLRRRTDVCPVAGSPPKRSLLEFSFEECPAPVLPETLYVENGARHDYTEDYRKLTSDFYLKF